MRLGGTSVQKEKISVSKFTKGRRLKKKKRKKETPAPFNFKLERLFCFLIPIFMTNK